MNHEEHLAKRREKRWQNDVEKRIENREETNYKFMKDEFDGQEVVHLVLGETFTIKDDLIMLGCRYRVGLGIYSTQPLDYYKTVEVPVMDLIKQNDYKEYVWLDSNTLKNVSKLYRELDMPTTNSQFQGVLGERMTITLTVVHVSSFSHKSFDGWGYTSSYFNKMVDDYGNEYIWKTSRALEVTEKYLVTGTVKAHQEYEGVKQTVLTRCKVENFQSFS